MIDHVEQAGIDLVTLGQGFVQVHRAHDGTKVGGRKGEDRIVEIINLISGLGGIEHLKEDHAIDRHHGIVLGDNFLARDIEHLLHHVDLAANAIDKGRH